MDLLKIYCAAIMVMFVVIVGYAMARLGWTEFWNTIF